MSKTNLILFAALALQGALIAGEVILRDWPAPGARGLLLAGVDVQKISHMQVQSQNETVNVDKEGDTGWKVKESQGYEADASKVEATLRELTALQISDVVATSKEHHAGLKVADGEYDRKVVLEGGGKKVELLFGTSSRANAVHVRKAGEDTVYTVADYSAWKLASQPSAWIDRTYFKANRQRVQHVAIKNSAGTFRLERETPKDWALVKENGERVPADADRVDAFLGDAAAMSLTEVGQKVDGASLSGDPVAELVLGLGEPPKIIAAHPAAPAGAASPAPEPAVVTETQTLQVYPKGAEKDRFVMHRVGATFFGEATKWNVQKLLEAKPDDFVAKEFDEPAPPELVQP